MGAGYAAPRSTHPRSGRKLIPSKARMHTRLPHSSIETGVPDLAQRRNTTIEDALRDAEGRFIAANPKSLAHYDAAQAHLPGGNTRTNMYFSPFPLTIMRGEGARLYDLDGHAYLDFLGEYTA